MPMRPVNRQSRLSHAGGTGQRRDDHGSVVVPARLSTGSIASSSASSRSRPVNAGTDGGSWAGGGAATPQGAKHHRRDRRVEGRVLAENGCFEIAQRRTRVNAHLLGEKVTQSPVDRSARRLLAARADVSAVIVPEMLVVRVRTGSGIRVR